MSDDALVIRFEGRVVDIDFSRAINRIAWQRVFRLNPDQERVVLHLTEAGFREFKETLDRLVEEGSA